MRINIKNMDKVEILRRLYNVASPQGMGYLQFTPENITTEEASTIFNSNKSKDFDYIKGRVMKIDLSGDVLDTRLYDRDNYCLAEDALKDMEGFEII
jgi:hypothetical protein